MNIDNVKEMLTSSDKQSRYLGISILRHNQDEKLISKVKSKKLIRSVDVCERIQNFSDICNELEITEESCLLFLNPKTKEEKCFNALNKIFKITKVYNGIENKDKFPDFTNSKQYKYFPYFDRTSGSWRVSASAYWLDSGSSAPGGIYFRDKNHCNDAVYKFLDIYSDYLM